MNTSPKIVGERSEGQILAVFLKAGKTVLIPFGDSQRYDLVLDEDGKFIRVQCKTGRIEKGCIVFNSCSVNWSTKVRRDYKGQADLFAIYVPETSQTYLLPVDSVGASEVRLRIDPTKNGQTKGIRLASDFEFRS